MAKDITLHPYQRLAAQHILANPRCNLHAGMGMGKTLSTLVPITVLLRQGKLGGPVLVIAPKRVALSVWAQEAQRWGQTQHLVVSVMVGTAAERLAALRKPADVYVVNYDSLVWLVQTAPDWPFAMVVADEATKLKSFRLRKGSTRAAALAKVAFRSPRWVNLTGSPAANGLLDLWGQQWFVDQGAALGKTFTAFRDRWFTVGYDGYSLAPKEHAEREIAARMAPTTLTLKPEDWFGLSQPVVRSVRVTLPDAAQDAYASMLTEFLVEVKDTQIAAANVLVKTAKLRQIANGHVIDTEGGETHDLHDEKLAALGEVIEEAGGESVLVVAHFRRDIQRICDTYHGVVLADDATAIDRWNAGRIPILVVHPKSAGHGLNLAQGGRIVVFFGLDWSLEDYEQVIERVGPTRQKQLGLDRAVLVYHLIAEGTVDDVILQRLESKASLQDALSRLLNRRTQ